MKYNEKITLLLVEDEELLAMTEKMMLQKYGYNVYTVNSGEKAIETVKKNDSINLILMDIDLGEGLDGTETAKMILEYKEIPIVFFSSHSEPEIVEKTEKISSYGYILKNSSITVIDASIKMAFKLFEEKNKVQKHENQLKKANKELLITNEKLNHSNEKLLEVNKELNAANEELSAVNEEHNATNEELNSTNEELNTSNEELISANEELDSTNEELNKTNIKLIEIKEQLQYSEKKYRLLTNDLPALICEFLPDGTLTFVNKTYCEYFETTSVELIGKKFLDFIPAKDREHIIKSYMSLTPVNPINDYTHKVIHKNEIKWHKWKDRALFDSKGKLIKFISIGLDITDRKLIQEELLFKSKGIENSINAIAFSDMKGNITDVNQSYLDMWGYNKNEVISSHAAKFFKNPDDLMPIINEIIDAERMSGEFEAKKKDGTIFQVLFSGNIIKSDNNEPLGLMASFIDITEIKLKEQKIKSLLNDKEILLKETHHRIKNNMITLRSILLLESNLKKDNSECSKVLNDCSNRVLSMMMLYEFLYKNEIKSEMNIKNYLYILLQKLVEVHKNISVKTELTIDDVLLNPKTIYSIGIIINELFSNSIKYAFEKNETPTISIILKRNKNNIKIIFSDNGIGLPLSFSIDNNPSFGLQLVNMFVQQIGGNIITETDSGTKYIIDFNI